MTLNVYGVEGTFPDTQFAQMIADTGKLPEGHGVAAGLLVGVSTTADRTVTISSGRATGAGASFYSDTTYSLALPLNTSGQSRIDLIVAQWDWAAARTAFLAAGGISNIDAASAAAWAAAGSFTYVKGTPGASPQAPYDQLIQNPGTPSSKWQEPLAEQLVRNNVGTFSVTTDASVDVRRLAVLSKEITLPGTFTRDSADPLTIERVGDLVTLSGHVYRGTSALGTTGAGDDTSASWGSQIIIPKPFWPPRTIDIPVRSGGGGPSTAMPTSWFNANKDGTALLTAGIGYPITANSLIRFGCTTWRAAS